MEPPTAYLTVWVISPNTREYSFVVDPPLAKVISKLVRSDSIDIATDPLPPGQKLMNDVSQLDGVCACGVNTPQSILVRVVPAYVDGTATDHGSPGEPGIDERVKLIIAGSLGIKPARNLGLKYVKHTP